MIEETTIQFLGILIAVTGLLGWLLKAVIGYFIKSSNQKSKYLETLVGQNQKNTEDFTNTINHQRTLDREMQSKHLQVIGELKIEMKSANEVNTKMLNFLMKTKQ